MTYEILSERRAPDYRISSPSDAFEVFKRYANSRVEKFAVAVLNSAHHVIAVKLISIGTVNRAIAAPREVFYPAIILNGVAIIAMHTHPSNCTNPSEEDSLDSQVARCRCDLGNTTARSPYSWTEGLALFSS